MLNAMKVIALWILINLKSGPQFIWAINIRTYSQGGMEILFLCFVFLEPLNCVLVCFLHQLWKLDIFVL